MCATVVPSQSGARTRLGLHDKATIPGMLFAPGRYLLCACESSSGRPANWGGEVSRQVRNHPAQTVSMGSSPEDVNDCVEFGAPLVVLEVGFAVGGSEDCAVAGAQVPVVERRDRILDCSSNTFMS